MNNTKIVVLDYATMNLDGFDISPIKEWGEVTLYKNTAPDEVELRAKEAEILITNKVVITKKHMEACPNLRYVVVSATGYNVVDIVGARNLDIQVSNVRGYSTEGVVQHTFALLLACLNKPEFYGVKVNGGEWQSSENFTFYDHSINELAGMTMGIYGYGSIGIRVAQVASAFGMKVIAYKRNRDNVIHPQHELVSVERLLTESDVISLHAPLNSESEHFINRQTINKMKEGAIIINTARGGLVNEADLAAALRRGRIACAGIDTISTEPPVEGNELIGIPNCIVTPHIAWASLPSRKRLLNGVIENIKSYYGGKPINLVS